MIADVYNYDDVIKHYSNSFVGLPSSVKNHVLRVRALRDYEHIFCIKRDLKYI